MSEVVGEITKFSQFYHTFFCEGYYTCNSKKVIGQEGELHEFDQTTDTI